MPFLAKKFMDLTITMTTSKYRPKNYPDLMHTPSFISALTLQGTCLKLSNPMDHVIWDFRIDTGNTTVEILRLLFSSSVTGLNLDQ